MKREPRKTIQVQLEVQQYPEQIEYIEKLIENKEWKPTFLLMLDLYASVTDGNWHVIEKYVPDLQIMKRLKETLDDGKVSELKRQYPDLWHWLIDTAREQAHQEALELIRAMPSQSAQEVKPAPESRNEESGRDLYERFKGLEKI